MTVLITELTKRLKEVNAGKSLTEAKTKNTAAKNSENKVELDIVMLLEFSGYNETKDIDPKPNYFVFQPNGTQKSPDILVKDIKNNVLAIEAKSGKTMMFNSGIPNPEYYYMCEYLDGTAYRGYGKDIFNPLVFTLMPQLRKEFDEHNKAPLDRLKNKNLFTPEQLSFINSANLFIYPRAMTQGIPSNSPMWVK